MYPKFLKSMALRSPVLGGVVRERDRLRHEFIKISGERDRLKSEFLSASGEIDKLRQEISLISVERDRLSSEYLSASGERDGLRQEIHLISIERDRLTEEKENSLGYCHCCRSKAIFEAKSSWLRDNYFCLTCHSIPRQRHIQYILDIFFKGWENKNIHESSPSNKMISQYCKDYSFSQYFHDVENGEMVGGVRCENLESLTFADGTFDIFITQDVFEHIFNPDRAAEEIMRVLKPGGAHVFTAPKHKGITQSYPRARISEGQIQYLKEADYHGNPVGDGRALVTWDYGDDFEMLMNGWSKSSTTTYVTKDISLGLDGEYLEVFVIKKPI